MKTRKLLNVCAACTALVSVVLLSLSVSAKAAVASDSVIIDISSDAKASNSAILIQESFIAAEYDSHRDAYRLNYYNEARDQNTWRFDRTGTGSYGIRLRLTSPGVLTDAHRYVCITYNTDCEGAYTLDITDSAYELRNVLVDDISVSGGKFVTSCPVKISESMLSLLRSGDDFRIISNTLNRNTELFISGLSFFTSEEQALKYHGQSTPIKKTDVGITVNGAPIKDYTVIVPAGEENRLSGAVKVITDAVKNAVGTELKVKTDIEPVSPREILIGATNRTESRFFYDAANGKFVNGELTVLDFAVSTINGKLVIAADLYAVLEQTVPQFANAYLTERGFNFENGFEISCICDDRATGGTKFFKNYPFTKVESSFSTPNTYQDGFEDETAGNDPDYWTEDPIDMTALKSYEEIGTSIDFSSYESFTKTASINPDVKSSPDTDTKKLLFNAWIGAWQFEDGYVRVLPTQKGMTLGGAYRLAFNPKAGTVTDEFKYMCIEYSVSAPENAKGTLELRMNSNVIVLDSELKNTDGSFVFSAPVDISVDKYLFDRWKGLNHNAVCFNFGTASAEIDVCVKEIRFFKEIDAAAKYAAGELNLSELNAPAAPRDRWKVYADGGNSVYRVTAKDRSFSFLHTFEKNVELSAQLKLSDACKEGEAGLACRVNDDLAYVIAGYDANESRWFIESRQGESYMPHRTYGEIAEPAPGEWYDLKLVANERNISLYINGSSIPAVSTDAITHLSPGRVALFAENASVMFDNVNVILTSCQSRIEKDVITMTLPITAYTEGGTVFPLNDGRLLFLHGSSQLVSHNMGLSWENTYWANIVQHANVYRLSSGKIIRLEEITADGFGYYASTVSSDEGKTWSSPTAIAPKKYNNVKGSSCIMNDKFMQMSDGRLFFSCTYNDVDGNGAHVEIYYSDDEGTTWTKSKTSSLDLTAGTNVNGFAESKIIETADGTLRMLTTWIAVYDCMVYSESKDNGITWGPLVPMPEFKCSQSSSDVFRDPETGIYYLVWVYNERRNGGMPRSRLSLAMSTDGISWQYCMDVDRWESPLSYDNTTLVHLVDPFVKVVGDYIFVGTGISETLGNYTVTVHKGQVERIYRIPKGNIKPYDVWPSAVGME